MRSRSTIPSGGLTLLELLVSTAVVGMVLIVIGGTITMMQNTWVKVRDKADLYRSARTAMETMSRRLVQATLAAHYEAGMLNADEGQIIRRSDLLEPAGGWDSFAVVQRARDQADNVRQALWHDLLTQYANDMRHPDLTAEQRARRIAAIEAALAPSISLDPANPETPPCPAPSN